MNSTPRFHLPRDLPPTTALALFDLLSALTDALWQQYETELVALIMEEIDVPPVSQLTFDFNDELPF